MLAENETSYDRVLYPSHAFAQTHPDRLAAIASLHGLTPAPIPGGRVLELGCGSGGNLIPMACQLPDTEFLGIDLAQRATESGNATIAQLGLRNVRLQHRNIMDVSDADGRFDYIIAHGVYSWVPQFVRDKTLSIFSRNLSPHGVAFVSYNAFPGAHLRNLVRSMMLFHVRAATDPRERIAQSRGLMKFLAEAGRDEDIYGFILRDQFDRIKNVPDEVFIHDDLDEGSTPFFLYQVVEAAAREGLQYLADAEFPNPREYGCSPKVAGMLSQMPAEQIVTREQYLDFIDGRAFRQSLFCHHDVPLRRAISPQCVKDYYLTTKITLATDGADPSDRSPVEFKAKSGGALRTDHPLSKAAIATLSQVSPQALAFPDLVQRASALLPAAAPAPDADEIEALTNVLFQAFRAGLVELRREPARLTTAISERPEASPYARWQAAQTGDLFTNLAHDGILIEDDVARRFVSLLDGTRDLQQLGADVVVPQPDAKPAGPESIEAVRENLAKLAKCGLLVA